MTQMAPNLIKSTRYLRGYLYLPWFILGARVGEGSDIQPYFKAISRQAVAPPGVPTHRIGFKQYLSPLLNNSKPKKRVSLSAGSGPNVGLGYISRPCG